MMLFPGAVAGIFTSDTALIEYTTWSMRIYMAGIFAMGFQIACQQSFMALGQAKVSLLLACLRKIILLIPLIFILPHVLPDAVFGVFLAEPVREGHLPLADALAALFGKPLTGTEKSVHVQSALEVVFVDISLGTVDDLHTICDLNDAVCTRFLLPVSIRHNESLVFDLDAQSSKAGIHMLDIVCTTQTFNDGRHHLVAHFLVQLLDLLAIIFAAGSLVVELGDHEAEGEIVQEEAGNANDEHPDPVRAFIRLHDAIEDRAQERAAEGTGPRIFTLQM